MSLKKKEMFTFDHFLILYVELMWFIYVPNYFFAS